MAGAPPDRGVRGAVPTALPIDFAVWSYSYHNIHFPDIGLLYHQMIFFNLLL